MVVVVVVMGKVWEGGTFNGARDEEGQVEYLDLYVGDPLELEHSGNPATDPLPHLYQLCGFLHQLGLQLGLFLIQQGRQT